MTLSRSLKYAVPAFIAAALLAMPALAQTAAAPASPLKSPSGMRSITARSWLPQSENAARSRTRSQHSLGRGP